MRFAIATIFQALGWLLVIYSIGGIIWAVHIDRKFWEFDHVVRHALSVCSLTDANSSTWTLALAQATHNLYAMQRTNVDYKKVPLWFLKLRGRWNADYLQEVANGQRG